jgi:transposase
MQGIYLSKFWKKKRKLAIKLRVKGMKNIEVVELIGLSLQTISTYYSKYKKDGAKVLRSSRRVGECKTFINHRALSKEMAVYFQKANQKSI